MNSLIERRLFYAAPPTPHQDPRRRTGFSNGGGTAGGGDCTYKGSGQFKQGERPRRNNQDNSRQTSNFPRLARCTFLKQRHALFITVNIINNFKKCMQVKPTLWHLINLSITCRLLYTGLNVHRIMSTVSNLTVVPQPSEKDVLSFQVGKGNHGR